MQTWEFERQGWKEMGVPKDNYAPSSCSFQHLFATDAWQLDTTFTSEQVYLDANIQSREDILTDSQLKHLKHIYGTRRDTVAPDELS
jgi:hypothetical protein